MFYYDLFGSIRRGKVTCLRLMNNVSLSEVHGSDETRAFAQGDSIIFHHYRSSGHVTVHILSIFQ